MLMFDGVPHRSSPITLAELDCGCIAHYDGHDIRVDDIVPCPHPASSTGHDQNKTVVLSTTQTHVV